MEASHQVLWLGGLIAQNLEKRGQRLTRVWIDKQERATLDGMCEGVRLCRNYILFLTKQVLTREFCLNEIRSALKYRKNVIIVVQADKHYGGVPGSFSEFYGPKLKEAFPHVDDYMWLMRNSYVYFCDRGQQVDEMLCAILDEMELEEAPQVVLPHRLLWAARASGPNSHSMCAPFSRHSCASRHALFVTAFVHSLSRAHAGRPATCGFAFRRSVVMLRAPLGGHPQYLSAIRSCARTHAIQQPSTVKHPSVPSVASSARRLLPIAG
jgi:hypothetical protein